MDIERAGANCLIITAKKCKIVVDPKLSDYGLKNRGEGVNVQLLTQPIFGAASSEGTLVLDSPGDYEIQDVSIKGIAARGHMDDKDAPMTCTIFKIETSGLSLIVTGHIYPELSDAQLEALGTADALAVPVGNSGYTLDAAGAIHLIKDFEPKMVIPVHYSEPDVNYPVPQTGLEVFVKSLGAPVEQTTKLKLKSTGTSDILTVFEIKRVK